MFKKRHIAILTPIITFTGQFKKQILPQSDSKWTTEGHVHVPVWLISVLSPTNDMGTFKKAGHDCEAECASYLHKCTLHMKCKNSVKSSPCCSKCQSAPDSWLFIMRRNRSARRVNHLKTCISSTCCWGGHLCIRYFTFSVACKRGQRPNSDETPKSSS